MTIDPAILHDLAASSRLEWIETNGLGGWASSTVIGMHTRRYHGLLVAATRPPVGRMVMLSKLDESITVGDERFELGTNQYAGTVHPSGYVHLQSFSREFFPVFEFAVGGVVLRKTIAAIQGENTTVIVYDVLDAPSSFTFQLLPLMSPRDYHSLSHANVAIHRGAEFVNGVLRVQAYAGVPGLYVSVPDSAFEAKPDWYYGVEYAIEQYRGLDYMEDLFSYGTLSVRLNRGERLGIIISTQDPAGRDAVLLLGGERKRRERIVAAFSPDDGTAAALALAADQFLVQRDKDQKTIIAGYHWFADWGRDTMIALPGLCLVTGKFEEAKQILRAFARHVSEGMLPNRFPDNHEAPEYNTADATLWFFVAVYKYLEYTRDDTFVRDELMPILRDIIAWHDRGTRYGIHVDSDGLLYAGEQGVQLTWMDAKVGTWVVTPRIGKAVEINALWYNVLKIYSSLAKRYEFVTEARKSGKRARMAARRFEEVFWIESAGALYDVVDGERRDPSIRPNQLFAISLPFPLLDRSKRRRVLKVVMDNLFTPMGLRSLAPDDPAYRASYGGDQYSRDGAYHQGTVWSWLLGPLCTALGAVEGKSGRERARAIIAGFLPHLTDAGIGTISEIFDGDPPHTPRGCIAQAWSVGELLRAYIEDVPVGRKETR
jgi:predicted glycogen debranching enzyme